MITADQLVVHGIGDYVLQSHWMASNKTERWWPALCHALVYSCGFLVLKPSWAALAVIFATHYFIDRYRLARFVVMYKNWLLGPFTNDHGMSFVTGTGYPAETPAWLAVWLLIIADNILHVLINGAALRWL